MLKQLLFSPGLFPLQDVNLVGHKYQSHRGEDDKEDQDSDQRFFIVYRKKQTNSAAVEWSWGLQRPGLLQLVPMLLEDASLSKKPLNVVNWRDGESLKTVIYTWNDAGTADTNLHSVVCRVTEMLKFNFCLGDV